MLRFSNLGSAFLMLAGAVHLSSASPHYGKPAFNWADTKYFIAFGDSYTYVQGTAGHQNFSFIGDYLPGNFSFSPRELLTDRIVQNFYGTSAGGPGWTEFLTGCAVKDGEWLPAECDIQLWNFAFAGADVSEEFAPLHHDFTVPMVNQTQQYLTYAEPVLGRPMDKSKALVAIWIGINDIGDVADYDGSLPELYEQILTTMFEESVRPLYKAGYHNFLLLNLPPRERAPGNLGNPAAIPSKEMNKNWNAILRRLTRKFERRHRRATTMLYDAYGFLSHVLDNNRAYGFTNVTDFCPGYTNASVLTDPGAFGCPVPIDEYFWFNSGHITSHAHEVLAKDLDHFLKRHSRR